MPIPPRPRFPRAAALLLLAGLALSPPLAASMGDEDAASELKRLKKDAKRYRAEIRREKERISDYRKTLRARHGDAPKKGTGFFTNRGKAGGLSFTFTSKHAGKRIVGEVKAANSGSATADASVTAKRK